MKISSTINSSFTRPKPNPQADWRLFYFFYAGGSSLIFRTWADILPESVEVCPVEISARRTQMKSPPFTRMEFLVIALALILLSYLDKLFAFFGHSRGGLLSFELACQLPREHELKPVHLFVSATRSSNLATKTTYTRTTRNRVSSSITLT